MRPQRGTSPKRGATLVTLVRSAFGMLALVINHLFHVKSIVTVVALHDNVARVELFVAGALYLVSEGFLTVLALEFLLIASSLFPVIRLQCQIRHFTVYVLPEGMMALGVILQGRFVGEPLVT